MNKNQRAIIAAIVMAKNQAKKVDTTYSYEENTYLSFSGFVSEKRIEAYDYSRGCYVSGNATGGNKYSLYDYGTSSYIELEIKSNNFTGYDYNSGSFYSGEIQTSSVSLYDYQTGSYYNFSN